MRLKKDFYLKPTLFVARALLGKTLVRKIRTKKIRVLITETEAYVGTKDMASHARFGITERNRIMFSRGGNWYVYLIYGLHYLVNVTTGREGHPGAVLLRQGILLDNVGKYKKGELLKGPAILTKVLKIDKKFNLQSLQNPNLYIEEGEKVKATAIQKLPRVGIDYAGEYKSKLWRFRYSK
jgi:DNA-3-methyladenine glycosylase